MCRRPHQNARRSPPGGCLAREECAGSAAFIVERRPGFELEPHVIGKPLLGQLRHGHCARRLAGLTGLALDDGISTLADIREHSVGLLARLGHLEGRAVANGAAGLADEEDAASLGCQPEAKGRQQAVEKKYIAVGDSSPSSSVSVSRAVIIPYTPRQVPGNRFSVNFGQSTRSFIDFPQAKSIDTGFRQPP